MGNQDWIAPLDAGPLTEAARRFLESHPGAPASPFPRGVDGLRSLAAALDAWADVEPSALDEGFIEGGGALLALVLLDHVGIGAHVSRDGVHRVRLGPDGFVDPFAAMRDALESDDPPAALIDAVAHAEAEARGELGVGRATRLLREALARERPDLRIVDTFGPQVRLDSVRPDAMRPDSAVEIDLNRLLRATRDEPEATAKRAIRKLITMLPSGDGAGQTLADVRSSLLPRVTAPGFAASLAEHGELAFRARLGGAVELALIIAHDDRSRYVGAHELLSWSVTFDEALAIAIGNLAGRSGQARFARVDTDAGPLVVARTGDGLDAARLLLPSLHDVLAPELGDTFLVAIPHRDALFACADQPALAAALTERARLDAAKAPHQITERLFRVDCERVVAR